MKNIQKLSRFIRAQWFILSLVFFVVMGLLVPQAAAINVNGRVTSVIVMIVFLGMGITLPTELLVSGISRWKNHLYIQLFIFLIFPLIVFLTLYPIKSFVSVEIYTGLLALSVLPTTISTCVIFTQICSGDTVMSLFNASLSNVLGVFLSPVLLSILLKQIGHTMPFEVLIGIITGLALKIVLPLSLGQIIRRFFSGSVDQLKKPVGMICNILILLIIFFSLAKSASSPQFGISPRSIAILFGYLIILHLALTLLAVWSAKQMRFSGQERISVMFTAPQKTLAMGVPLLSTYFATDPELLGIAIVPLLFYHPWQLFISGMIKSLPVIRDWSKIKP